MFIIRDHTMTSLDSDTPYNGHSRLVKARLDRFDSLTNKVSTTDFTCELHVYLALKYLLMIVLDVRETILFL